MHTRSTPDRAPRGAVVGLPAGAGDVVLDLREPGGRYVTVVKPLLDRVLALVALLVLLPLMAAVALSVFISLGSPVLLRQRRIGRGGALFEVYKFRTMHADRRTGSLDEGYDGIDRRLTHKSEDDPRLTPTGRLLRRLSLDELPQLLNVLRGDMSLVGPRPELPAVVARHYAPWQHRRHLVKPGMTGLWQVSERGNGLMHEHVDVDLDYVDQVSLSTDLRILLRTLPAALGPNKGV
jgi:lipopolysaccharide/colanic/teichoic acid biosynthesis glycosyltransferase